MFLKPVSVFLLFIISPLFIDQSLGQSVLFIENFDDNDFSSRGWYDSPKGTISAPGYNGTSTACFECTFLKSQKGCAGETPGRHLFTETDQVYISYWVKYSSDWEGSNRPYHPHEFHIITNADDKFVGPAITHLTLYIEQNEGRPMLALQDGKNVDLNCILQNNGNFIGCNDNFDTYRFGENRSVASCNGIVGGYDRRDCFKYDNEFYYSARIWDTETVYFSDTQGSRYKNDWHHIETFFKLNSIVDDKGIADGKIRYWYDSELLISYDNILMRTAQFPNMKFNQFLIAPYIGDGSPVEQTMWIDDLTVATSPISTSVQKSTDTGQILIIHDPSTGFISISGYSGEVIIFDSIGRQVWQGKVHGEGRIDLSALGSGLYILKANNLVKKILIGF